MNILGHIIIGISGSIITNDISFLVCSIIPDIALIPNELLFSKFNKWKVKWKILYDISHSIYIPFILLFTSITSSIAYLLHIIIDIPFHSSSFRWKPFLINRYRTKKKALLLSGGADSILCGIIEKDYTCYFYDYGQYYCNEELECALQFCKMNNLKLNIIYKNWHTDIKDRNIMMIKDLKLLGYDEIIIGTRNIFPLFDKYGDSNWLRLKLLQYRLKIYINMPILGLFKFQIKDKIANNYKYYSTENI